MAAEVYDGQMSDQQDQVNPFSWNVQDQFELRPIKLHGSTYNKIKLT